MITAKPAPATASEIRAIVGDVQDATVASILQTGATEAEVLEAFTWISADDALGNEVDHGRRGVAGQVFEILQAEEPQENE